MPLEVPLSLEPMEAEAVDTLPPAGKTWQYEPKVDGFRCIVFRDGAEVQLQSRHQKPLQRFFPEVAAAVLGLPRDRFVLDGELVIPGHPFDALQARLHPAASRIKLLSQQTPAQFVAFDLLADDQGRSLLEHPFRERRAALEQFFAAIGKGSPFLLSKATASPAAARTWLADLGKGLDGIVAKRLDLVYQPGVRAMQKFKVWKTVDCVVGGIYRHRSKPAIEYLLMGLYDDAGRLTYVGRCGMHGVDAARLEVALEPLIGRGGFEVNQPGGESRWTKNPRAPIPVAPELVAEVSADHVENGRFRHGSRFVRWRPDKEAKACRLGQLGGV